MKLKNKFIFEKNLFKIFPLVRKIFSSRLLRFKLSSSGRQIALRFVKRGPIERKILWRFNKDVWLPDWLGGLVRQPLHRTIWVYPPLPDHKDIWYFYQSLNYYQRAWICIPWTHKVLHGGWDIWLFNRLVIVSAISSFVFVVTSTFLLFYFLFFIIPPALEFLFYTAQLGIWFVFNSFSPVLLFIFLGLFFLFLWSVSLRFSFHSLSPIWRPKWTVFRPLARPGLRRLIQVMNARQRQHLRFTSFFTWHGLLARHWFSVRSFVHNLHSLESVYNQNFFHWERTPNYHMPGVWHYNVIQDFWFDMHYNYPTFIGNFGQYFRDRSLDVHPFLMLRRIMTDVAVRLVWYLCGPYYHEQRFLVHYAKKKWIFFYALFCTFIGRTIFYTLILTRFLTAARSNFSLFCARWLFIFIRNPVMHSPYFYVDEVRSIAPQPLKFPFEMVVLSIGAFFRSTNVRLLNRYLFGAQGFLFDRHHHVRFDLWTLSHLRYSFPFVETFVTPQIHQFYSNFFPRAILNSSFKSSFLASETRQMNLIIMWRCVEKPACWTNRFFFYKRKYKSNYLTTSSCFRFFLVGGKFQNVHPDFFYIFNFFLFSQFFSVLQTRHTNQLKGQGLKSDF